MKRFYSPAELAELLGVKRETLVKWRKRKTGPAYYRVGLKIRYDSADVERWMESRKEG